LAGNIAGEAREEGTMSKRLVSTLVLAICAIALTACNGSQATPTAPVVTTDLTATTADAKGGNSSGGKGSPHFVAEFTSCNFDSTNGHMVCDYQVAGLGKNGHALITLAGVETLHFRCAIWNINLVDFFAKADIWGDRSGNYAGTIDASPLYGPLCNNNVSWDLTGAWTLTGLVDTSAGPTVPILYVQPLT
jgi:hypothetical protein